MGYRSLTETRTVTEREMVYYDIGCDNCERLLEPADGVTVAADGGWDRLAPRGALWVRIVGGYGNYFDTPGNDPVLLFCDACAAALFEAFPVLRETAVRYEADPRKAWFLA